MRQETGCLKARGPARADNLRLMSESNTVADVAVVGLGRVGLPLALSFADRGLTVIGIDNDPARLGSVREGLMPFQETDAQALLERVGQRAPAPSQNRSSTPPRPGTS